MGNWRTVRIVGDCDPSEVEKLTNLVEYRRNDRDQKFHPLLGGVGLMGLPVWAKDTFDVVGNCAERDYSIETIAETVEWLCSEVKSLVVTVHCGGGYEDRRCVASIVILRSGKAEIRPPLIEDVGEISESQMMDNLMRQIGDKL